MTSGVTRSAFLASILLPSLALAQAMPATKPSRPDVIAAARDVMEKAAYTTFITIGEDGQPQARVVDPTAPDANLIVWIGTNSLTRKLKDIARDPRVTLLYFHAASAGYVTLIGRAAVVTDASEKERRWKKAGRRSTRTDFATAVLC